MSLRIYLSDPYKQTHEREQFEKFCNICKDCFANTDEPNLLFGNICLNSAQLDALLIKPDSIIIVEFKNYGGDVLASENGDWKLSDGTIIKGGANGRNPYLQTRHNKFEGVMRAFNEFFPKTYVNLGHIAGLVVFNKRATINDRNISDKTKTWFHITDMEHVASKLRNITSPEISYRNNDIDEIPRIFNYDEVRDLLFPCIDDIIDDLEKENKDTKINEINLPDYTDIVNSKDDPGVEFNGGIYHGGWKDGLPYGNGTLENAGFRYEGCWDKGYPAKDKDFTVKSIDRKDPITFDGTLTPEMKPNEGRLSHEYNDPYIKIEFRGIFDGWCLIEGEYLKNGVLYKEGTFKPITLHNGRISLELVEGRKREENFDLGNGCKFTGLIDIQTKLPEDEKGELIDAKGNKFVGPFKSGKKNGRFELYLSGVTRPIICNYKDDEEI